jgi:hypothetical protein
MYTLLQLLFSQIDASRQLKGGSILANAIFVEEVIWDNKGTIKSSSEQTAVASDILLEEMISKVRMSCSVTTGHD